jgi:Protein of unknown function (DUF2950)
MWTLTTDVLPPREEAILKPSVNTLRVVPCRRLSRLIVVGVILLLAGSLSTYAANAPQATFARPDQAASALVAAAQAESMTDLLRILGPEGKPLVSSGDTVADQQALENFVALYAEANRITTEGTDHATLVLGKDEWPFPIPLVGGGGEWRFDTAAGKEEILDRRIGLNELSVIDVCLAYAGAQREYASKDRNNDGFDEYAQKFASSPGKRDGLYWPTKADEQESPLGPLVAAAQAAGYKAKSSQGGHMPYYGYYYRILYGQGKDAPGGAYDYVVNGHMIGGFALVAFPAQYDVSGITTFIVNHDGLVYQKDLGPHSAEIATQMTRFNPDATWAKQ